MFVRGDFFMTNENRVYSFEDYCEIIETYSSCMDDYPYVMDMQQDKYFISEKAVRRFNVPKQLFNNVIKTHEDFVYKDDIDMLVADLNSMVDGEKDEHNINYRWLDKKKKSVWINCRGKLLRDEDGKPMYMIGCVNEIGEAGIADNVSGLLQSTQLKMRMEEQQDKELRGFALRIGIDGFKDINEKFGTDYGDFVLKGVADCITSQLSDKQSVYHVVSDEYIVIDLEGGTDVTAHELYRKIRRSIDIFIEENNYEAVYTVSGGVLLFDSLVNRDYASVMKHSQFALSEAKARGKNQIYFYNRADYDNFLRKRKIVEEIRHSIADNYKGFELYFQPIMTAPKYGEKLYAAESLIRFTTSDGEFLSPVEFIPILEDTGLIIPVGRWVLDNAARMCKLCQRKYPDFKISINLSYVQILKSALVNEIFNCIGRNGLKPNSIIVEMTESGYLEDTPAVRRVWDNLKRYGVLIAIDDFGTGYSNLQCISRMTPDIVKIDRGFTVKALNNFFENQLMTHIIQLVHSINLKICVEGVENTIELEKLHLMDPDFIQGYYYSKPLPKEQFIEKYID